MDLNASNGGGEKWSDCRNILKVKPTRYVDRLDRDYEREESNMPLRFLA